MRDGAGFGRCCGNSGVNQRGLDTRKSDRATLHDLEGLRAVQETSAGTFGTSHAVRVKGSLSAKKRMARSVREWSRLALAQWSLPFPMVPE